MAASPRLVKINPGSQATSGTNAGVSGGCTVGCNGSAGVATLNGTGLISQQGQVKAFWYDSSATGRRKLYVLPLQGQAADSMDMSEWLRQQPPAQPSLVAQSIPNKYHQTAFRSYILQCVPSQTLTAQEHSEHIADTIKRLAGRKYCPYLQHLQDKICGCVSKPDLSTDATRIDATLDHIAELLQPVFAADGRQLASKTDVLFTQQLLA